MSQVLTAENSSFLHSVTDEPAELGFPASISAIAEAVTCQRPDPVWLKSTDAARDGCASATALKGTAQKFAS